MELDRKQRELHKLATGGGYVPPPGDAFTPPNSAPQARI